MPDGYWIPMDYKGTHYVEEMSVVVSPPVVIPSGEVTFTATIKDDVTGEVWSGILKKI